MSDDLEGAIEVSTPWIKLRGTGILAAMVVLSLLTIAAIFWNAAQTQEEHRVIVNSLQKVTDGLNDMFLATVLTPEQKADLPGYVKERAKEKVKEKAERKLNE